MYDPATAKALLDRFGYDKRDPDGFRRAPDGSRLTLALSLRTGGIMREVQTLWKKNMEAIGLRTDFNVAPFQEIIKDLEKGKFQMYQGGFGGSPSGYNEHSQLHGKQPQRVNTVQFANAEYDRAAEEFLKQPLRRRAACRGADDVRDCAYVHAALARVFPAGEQLRPAVAQGIPPRRVLELLEISRRRSRPAEVTEGLGHRPRSQGADPHGSRLSEAGGHVSRHHDAAEAP